MVSLSDTKATIFLPVRKFLPVPVKQKFLSQLGRNICTSQEEIPVPARMKYLYQSSRNSCPSLEEISVPVKQSFLFQLGRNICNVPVKKKVLFQLRRNICISQADIFVPVSIIDIFRPETKLQISVVLMKNIILLLKMIHEFK